MADLAGSRFVHDSKIDRYLLNLEHPEGGPKARYFMRFGFDPAAPETLRHALLSHPETNQVVATETTTFGLKSTVECNLTTPDGRNPCIISIWIAEPGSTIQRFVTAIPG